DLRLLVVDASEDWTEEDTRLLSKIRPLGPLLVACNKCDLPPRITPADLERILRPGENSASAVAPGFSPASSEDSRAVAPGFSPAPSEGRLGPLATVEAPWPSAPVAAPLEVVWTSALT